MRAQADRQTFLAELDASYKALRRRANALAHSLAMNALGADYVNETRKDATKRYAVLAEEQTTTAPFPLSETPAACQRPGLLATPSVTARNDSRSTAALANHTDVQVNQQTDTPFSIVAGRTIQEERKSEFVQDAAKARAKSRALAELKLEEIDLREQQVQLKIEKLQAKRALLEFDGEDD